MKPVPEGWARINSSLFYDDPAKAIDWLVSAFGFEIQLKVEDGEGRIAHSELVFGGATIMVGDTQKQPHRRSPKAIDGLNTQSLMMYVDDVDAHCKRAREHGATITTEPKVTDYGEDYWSDRVYEAVDPEGHRWWFVERLRSPDKPPPKYAKE
jgi:uncharacterized glyoxalase superfamily protein PhnB